MLFHPHILFFQVGKVFTMTSYVFVHAVQTAGELIKLVH